MKLMLDSGAYSAWRKGTEIDIDAYIEFVEKYGHLFECCVNLDVIHDGKASYMNWMYLRRNGIDTMPVYHIGTEEKWLEKYLKKAEYIGIGAIANLSSVQRFKGLDSIWNKYLKGGNYKIHGMGLTAVDIMTRYPWYSVDSISPILQAGFGGIYVPRIESGALNFLKMDMFKVSDKSKAHQAKSIETKSMSSIWADGMTTIRERYERYFEENGYKLGHIRAQSKPTPMYGEEDGLDGEERTLSNWYVFRVNWNLKMWVELSRVLDDIILYVGSSGHFQYVAKINSNIGQLFTFYDTNKQRHVDKILRIMKDNGIKPNEK